MKENFNCEQLAREKSWDLAETNACHLRILNDEMGDIRDAQVIMQWEIGAILAINGIILASIVSSFIKVVFRKLFPNNKGGK